ncbi:MAG: SRPBCC domain-containing protein [Anaerolineae bacterium]|nr:SRPBCC domain-containing protein [Anaerolineae bacterium]
MAASPQPLSITMEVIINAPAQKIWDFLVREEGLKTWLGAKVYEPRLGGEVRFRPKGEGKVWHIFGQIITLDPPHTLAFTWLQEEEGGERWPAATTVTITLTPSGNGTHVSVVHSGFEQLPEAYRIPEYDSYVEGWGARDTLLRLKQIIEEKDA